MIVSLGLFSVVVTIAVGALLILIASNRQLQQEQSVLSNVSFALDSMTREIRTGTQYYCESHPVTNGPGRIFRNSTLPPDSLDNLLTPDDVQDCSNGNSSGQRFHGLAFIEGGNSLTGTMGGRILYFFDEDTNKIYRRLGSGAAQSIVSDGIHIINAEFFLTGSEPLLGSGPTDNHQSAVTIIIEAAESAAADAKRHTIQTTITQRTLDI